MQLHPGDLGWFWRFGAEAAAAAIRATSGWASSSSRRASGAIASRNSRGPSSSPTARIRPSRLQVFA
jgi:hypothetical protein